MATVFGTTVWEFPRISGHNVDQIAGLLLQREILISGRYLAFEDLDGRIFQKCRSMVRKHLGSQMYSRGLHDTRISRAPKVCQLWSEILIYKRILWGPFPRAARLYLKSLTLSRYSYNTARVLYALKRNCGKCEIAYSFLFRPLYCFPKKEHRKYRIASTYTST